MQTRTRLTTPPGQEPTADSSAPPEDEVYVPGLALPEEPSVPGRYRRPIAVLVSVVVLALATYATLQVMTLGEDFDPALDQLVDSGSTGEAPAPDAELPDS